ncbi:AraC family transcriptional regulator [Seonamhaeicola marinus]|uniref:AraC family transcriptional regulator n=1 Tax=Seonamhaeicola marinus TaxID=1912246 RepID=A0A5D0IPG8_9FLAO|nr:GyrI-like domain-containing protein [Seonamhaeicola marinus]TYA84257.1 AraC family transcriptional regulator [Seonamhaeicola marinus]
MDSEIIIDYKSRLNKVFNYIHSNLDAKLSLETVAQIAHFSPFHFHRVFKLITNETLNEYITRQRLEKAALDLLLKTQSTKDIALKYGFSDTASFSKAFKRFYDVSPTHFKTQNPNRFSKIRQLESKNKQQPLDIEKYICNINNLKNWIQMNANIEVKDIDKIEVAYISCIGSQNLGQAFQNLMQWAIPKGLMHDETKMATIYYDSFKVTPPHKVRMHACILLNDTVEGEGEIGFTTIEGGKCIIGSFEIGVHEFEKSWTGLFVWMNENGYKKADREPFEVYHNNFNEHPEKKAIVDFYIPVV